MEAYLLKSLFYTVKLRGPTGVQFVCHLEDAEAWPWNMVIRDDWIEFVAHNEFEVGDTLYFHMVNFHEDQVINVGYGFD
jgi:hypothetical protein